MKRKRPFFGGIVDAMEATDMEPVMQAEPVLPKLWSVEDVAPVLHKTPSAIREAMCRSKAPWAIWLSSRRVRLGRRYYFRQQDVLRVLECGDAVAQEKSSVVRIHPRQA